MDASPDQQIRSTLLDAIQRTIAWVHGQQCRRDAELPPKTQSSCHMMTAFWEAIQRPGGTVGRGPRRWYVELHPEALTGFADLVTHPWVTAMAEGVLGPDYQIVE